MGGAEEEEQASCSERVMTHTDTRWDTHTELHRDPESLAGVQQTGSQARRRAPPPPAHLPLRLCLLLSRPSTPPAWRLQAWHFYFIFF